MVTTRTKGMVRPVTSAVAGPTDHAAREMLARAAETGVATTPESENMPEMIQWVVGRLRWERRLESLRGSPSASTEEAEEGAPNG